MIERLDSVTVSFVEQKKYIGSRTQFLLFFYNSTVTINGFHYICISTGDVNLFQPGGVSN